ncbi:Cna B-type domain-containing protein [Secundilactobacillus yichangensis]|uniref:Cna B-type domain-containing protein n=1 Tax=Secundilactobacillus yichangensis TaxID=2799580 RepID=UPI001942ECB7|nr:Cna B-type domain-containing protein [Secundilactobacillus yichangensis]
MKKLLLAVSFLLAMLTLLILPVTANATANNVSVNTAVATSSTNSSKCIYPANLGKNTSTLNSSVDPRTTTKASQATVTDEQSEKTGTATTDNQSEKLETATTDEQSEKPNTVTTNDQSQKPATVTPDVTKTQNPTTEAEKTDPNHSNESFKEAVAPAVFVPEISYKSGEKGKDVSSDVTVNQQLTDINGNNIDGSYQKDIHDGDFVHFLSNFTINDTAVRQIKNGDYFSVKLPDQIVVTDTSVFPLIDKDLSGNPEIGSYHLVKIDDTQKLVRVTFNDYLEKNTGVTDVSATIDTRGKVTEGKKTISYQQGGTVPLDVKPAPSGQPVSGDPYRGKGPIVKEGYQVLDDNGLPTGEVNWTLNVNIDAIADALGTGTVSSDHVMKNAVIYDNLTPGQTVAQDSTPRLGVPIYLRDQDGNVLSTTDTVLGVNVGQNVSLADVAAANGGESTDNVTFTQFNDYVKSHLGSYGFFKQNSNGDVYGQSYTAGQYTFIMNVGDLGVKNSAGNQLSLTQPTLGSNEDQVRDKVPSEGAANVDQTVDGYHNLLKATGNSGIAGLHIEFRMNEDATFTHDLSNTAIVAHDGTQDTSKNYTIQYSGTDSDVELTIAQGVIEIHKYGTDKDSKGDYSKLAGAEFKITNATGIIVADLTTDDSGSAQTNALLSGTYTITEVKPVNGYQNTLLADGAGNVLGDGKSYTVTIDRNTDKHGVLVNIFNKKNTTNIEVTKTWNGVPTGTTTPTVTATLYANGIATTKTVTLSKDNGYADSFKDLDETDANGNKITYSVKEEPVAGYTNKNVTDTDDLIAVTNGKVALVNDYIPQKTNIEVTKTWNGVPTGTETPIVTATLYANGTATTKTVTLSKDNGYADSFKDLDETDANGNKIVYSIKEEPVAGYTIKNVTDKDGLIAVTNGKVALVNEYIPQKTNVEVTKTWVNVPANSSTPDVTVTLLANGKDTQQTLILTAANQFQGSFSNLDMIDANGQAITYSVKETPVAGYTAENNGIAQVVNGKAVLVNDYNRPPVNPNQPITNVKVVKIWKGVPAGTQTPDITVTLLADGESTGKTLVLTSKNHYTGSFTDLALTDANAKTIVYSVKETPVAGYTAENGGVATAVNGTATLVNDYDVPGKPEKPQTPPTPPVTPPTPPVTPPTPENPNTPNIPNTPITPEEPKTPNVPETPETTTDQNRVSTPSKNEANTPVASVHGEAVAPRKQDNVQPKPTEAKLPQTSEKQSSSAALIGVALLLMLFVPMTLLKKKA